ncbi:hypothetical protein GJAV_G00168000 [Gymnothorax javanicus]|nr:hypothetical protein GJAV_G00168000 [Gymnothorax javanicus]
MAGLPPGDPQLVSMIVNHLKTQGLFDQFRRDCLADVDTKPAYLHLRQRVDNFVSNHLANHTWSPHLNKNQLRNNIRQLVLQSGMLEQGVDRIVAQVVDPNIHHTFRPQVERVVRQFLSPGTTSEEPVSSPRPVDERPDNYAQTPGPSSVPVTAASGNAMSILDTITSLNQEASSWSGQQVGPERDWSQDEGLEEMDMGEQDMSLVEDEEEEEGAEAKGTEDGGGEEKPGAEAVEQVPESSALEHAPEVAGKAKEDGETQKSSSEKQHVRQKTRERLKEEYSLEDSDLDGLSDITVSSVHTSDLSSFEEESEEEPQLSDSTEEGEITSEEEEVKDKPETEDKPQEEEPKERKPRGGRQAYVHKPFLYSRYYSDSDDEMTVELRRRSAAKDKEERLLKRQQNRERMEEKRRQKASLQEETEEGGSKPSSPSPEPQGPSAKEARKQKKVLEKKVAISRERKKDIRKEDEAGSKKKGDAEEKSEEVGKGGPSKAQPAKGPKKAWDLEDRQRRKSGSVSEEGPAGGSSEQRRTVDRDRTHSFILDLEQGSESLHRHRLGGKFDRNLPKHPRERGERERSLSDERAKHKPKPERRGVGDAEESLLKDPGHVTRVPSEDKGEKKSKSRGDRRSSTSAREGRTSVSEGGASEESGAKRSRVVSADGLKADKTRMEKGTLKGESKLLLAPQESTGSSEDKSDIEPGSEVAKKKDRPAKDVSKRSKSQSEMRDGAEFDRQSRARSESDIDSGSKAKTAGEKSRSRSREDPKAQVTPRSERKSSTPDSRGKGTKVSKDRRREGASKEERRREGSLREERRGSEETTVGKARKGAERKSVEAEKKASEVLEEETRRGSKADEPSSCSSLSSAVPDTSTPTALPHTCIGPRTPPTPPPSALPTGPLDDTLDGLSDITPEPEDEGEMQIDEDDADTMGSRAEGPSVDCRPGGSDVTIGTAQSGWPQVERFEAAGSPSEMSLREAALTLLSMDPDTTTSPGLITEAISPEPLPPDGYSLPPAGWLSGGSAATEAREWQEPMETGRLEPEPTVHAEVLGGAVEGIGISEVASASERTIAETAAAEYRAETDREHSGSVVKPQSEGGAVADSEVSAPLEPSVEHVPEPDSEGSHITAAGSVEDGDGRTGGAPSSEQTCGAPAESAGEPVGPEDVLGQTDRQEEVLGKIAETSTSVSGSPRAEGERQSGSVGETEESAKVEDVRKSRSSGRQSRLVKQASRGSKSDRDSLDRSPEPSTDDREAEEANGSRSRRRRTSQSSTASRDSSKTRKEEKEVAAGPGSDQPPTSDDQREKTAETKGPRKRRWTKLRDTRSSSQESEDQESKEAEQPEKEKADDAVGRRRRSSAAQVKEISEGGQQKKEEAEPKTESSSEVKREVKEGEEKSEQKKTGRRGRPPKAPPQGSAQSEETSEQRSEQEAGESSESKETSNTRKAAVKRKRSEDREEPAEVQPEEGETKGDGAKRRKSLSRDDSTSQSDGQEDAKEEDSNDNDEDRNPPQKSKVGRRGRPAKGGGAAGEESGKTASEKKDATEEELDEEDDDEEAAATRATTRSASRLEAERNKPSKPSTRALSKLTGKEEMTPSARGGRAQPSPAGRGGRKREPSPPTPRTRGAQKSEEPPAKRGKR